MNVVVHNPSSIALNVTQIHVPNGHYDVKVFNKSSKSFEEVPASVYCWDDYDPMNVTFEACKIRIYHKI
jgi:hypothetical protein